MATISNVNFCRFLLSHGLATRVFILVLAIAAVSCAEADGREMVANGIGKTPAPSSDVVGPTSSLPEGKLPMGSNSEPVVVHGSVYVDSMAGTVGGRGSYELSYPQLDGLALDHPVNVALRGPIEELQAAFMTAVSEQSGEDSARSALERDSLQGSGMVWLLDDRLVSVVYEARVEWAGAADIDDRVDSVLVDLRTGTKLNLGDLFVTESPWLATIGFFARQELLRQLGTAGLWADGRGLELEASNYAVFGVRAEGLVVRFGLHQVAPGTAGTPEVVIGWPSLLGLIDPEGPAAHLVDLT